MKLARVQVRVVALFDGLVAALAGLAGLILALAIVIVLTEITNRYFFNRPILGAIEVTEYCLLWTTFLTAPWLQGRRGHVRVDFLVNSVSPRMQTILDAGTSSAGAAVCLITAYYGFSVTWFHFETGYLLSTPLRPPSAAIIVVIPIGAALLAIQFMRQAYVDFRLLRTEPNGR